MSIVRGGGVIKIYFTSDKKLMKTQQNSLLYGNKDGKYSAHV